MTLPRLSVAGVSVSVATVTPPRAYDICFSFWGGQSRVLPEPIHYYSRLQTATLQSRFIESHKTKCATTHRAKTLGAMLSIAHICRRTEIIQAEMYWLQGVYFSRFQSW